MKNSQEFGSQTSVAGRKRRLAVYAAGLLILTGLVSVLSIFKAPLENREPPAIVMRIDDIQDFSFQEAQLFLLNASMINEVPLSIAVIPGCFGRDREVVQTVKLAVSLGSEIVDHGWQHEDFAKLSLSEQVILLRQSKSRIKEILDYNVKVFAPPMFSFNDDTIAAMEEEDYSIISTCTNFDEPGLLSKVLNLPVTIKLSDFSGGVWEMKNFDMVKGEISRSIQKYGFAIIVTHPQEFVTGGKLNQANVKLYQTLIRYLKEGERK